MNDNIQDEAQEAELAELQRKHDEERRAKAREGQAEREAAW